MELVKRREHVHPLIAGDDISKAIYSEFTLSVLQLPPID